MTETVVHVTTLEQWKSVLDVWFKLAYEWASGERDYKESYFTNENSYYLVLTETGDIARYSQTSPSTFIEYSEFMAQQKEDNKMATYYVTQEQLDLIEELKGKPAPLDWIIMDYDNSYRALRVDVTNEKSNAIMRYLGGDETIEFKVKEQLYRLWRIDSDGESVYMKFSYGTPTWITDSIFAFTAPLEEIKKWQTPAWEIEKVEDQ